MQEIWGVTSPSELTTRGKAQQRRTPVTCVSLTHLYPKTKVDCLRDSASWRCGACLCRGLWPKRLSLWLPLNTSRANRSHGASSITAARRNTHTGTKKNKRKRRSVFQMSDLNDRRRRATDGRTAPTHGALRRPNRTPAHTHRQTDLTRHWTLWYYDEILHDQK